MSHSVPTIALCCYKHRALVLEQCGQCKAEYGCPEFKSKAAAVQFNAMIPPSMLLAPLPIELWPNMCPDMARDLSSQSSQCTANESIDPPLRRLVSILGLPIELDTRST
jgi:hypothetical protein